MFLVSNKTTTSVGRLRCPDVRLEGRRWWENTIRIGYPEGTEVDLRGAVVSEILNSSCRE
jgi:hypothetical protein